MRNEGKRLAIAGALLLVIEVLLWRWMHDVFVSVYASLLCILACFRALNWPKPAWLAGGHLEYVKNRARQAEIGKVPKGAKVAQLEMNQAAKQFFAAVIYQENNETLCNDIVEHFTPKILYYAVALMIAMFLDGPRLALAAPAKDTCSSQETALKLVGLITSALLPLMWDYTRYEKQKYWSKELRGSH